MILSFLRVPFAPCSVPSTKAGKKPASRRALEPFLWPLQQQMLHLCLTQRGALPRMAAVNTGLTGPEAPPCLSSTPILGGNAEPSKSTFISRPPQIIRRPAVPCPAGSISTPGFLLQGRQLLSAVTLGTAFPASHRHVI